MSSFVLKIIAMLSMLSDHMGYVIFHRFSFMNYIGRLAFPIFAFSITEGYKHTSNLKKYFCRLLIFALISQIPFTLFLSMLDATPYPNIIFTLILGLLAIYLYDKIKNKYLGIFVVISCAIISQLLHFDYGWFGISVIFILYIFKDKKLPMNLLFIIVTFINYFYKYINTLNYQFLIIIIFCCLSLIPINLYNGKKGKSMKYLFYIFYPLHLLALFLIDKLV